MKTFLVIAFLGFGIARIVFVSNEPSELTGNIFKALAHIYVGGLFGAAFMSESPFRWSKAGFYSGLAWGLTLLEVLAFAASKAL